MPIVEKIRILLGDEWIPQIYGSDVRSLKTRVFDLNFPERLNNVEIVHTLLGVQLRVGKKLIGCPDLASARYLRVFARIGCGIVAVPYDITLISGLADKLESSWQRSVLLLENEVKHENPQQKGRKKAAFAREMRKEIASIGPGDMMPAFDTETRQRNRK